MKSLNDNPVTHKNPDIFTPDILKWLENEGFNTETNDSYCDKLTDDPYEEKCFYKTSYNHKGSEHIGIYIFSYGIGVDVDYDCGGNLAVRFWKFSDYSFEEAYDNMVDFINEY